MKYSVNISALMEMAHSPIRNYVLPGMTSYLIGNPHEKGKVRLLVASRDTKEYVTPHSHRFDFQAQVLYGEVRNTIFTETGSLGSGRPIKGEDYVALYQDYCGATGKYEVSKAFRINMAEEVHTYTEGMTYRMRHDEIHSISFSAGTRLLIFEGPNITDRSLILQPEVDGEMLDTFVVRPWMFQHGPRASDSSASEA